MSIGKQSIEPLSQSFTDSLQEHAIECIGNITEIALDSILEDSSLKKVPFISAAISIYKIEQSIRDRHNLKKLAIFLDQINQGIQDEDTCQKYIKKFQAKRKIRDQELEYVIIMIDRYIRYDKPQMLAKLYLAYLNENISWNEFSVYAEVIDRFFPGDAELLCKDPMLRIGRENEWADSLARLISLGLMSEHMKQKIFVGNGFMPLGEKDKEYKITKFGSKLISILK